MAERFLKSLVTFLSVPVVVLARIVEALNAWGIRSDIDSCIDVIDSVRIILPTPFLSSLIAAEDHRNVLHPGVDPIAVFRAVYVRLLFGHVQGASTIEQQFVRVISGRYDKTLARKMYEQMLAVAVSRRRSKSQIATAYLSVAFYGSASIGVTGLRAYFGEDLSVSKQNDIRRMIAKLKYPEPLQPSSGWQRKIRRRIEYISLREDQLASSHYGSTPLAVENQEPRLNLARKMFPGPNDGPQASCNALLHKNADSYNPIWKTGIGLLQVIFAGSE